MNGLIHFGRKSGKSRRNFKEILSNFYARIIVGEDVRTDEEKMLENIRQAHDEWRNAEAYFQMVTDPDLIDYAIYRLEAAKIKYTYLMKLARETGLRGIIR
ncbi:YaaL family protein [Anaerosolibacter sp.]|uniref:YaaL family protein n=1 Tax=Anaerosolibacter sp. TaxID=1872527 RepID=UPI0039F0D927